MRSRPNNSDGFGSAVVSTALADVSSASPRLVLPTPVCGHSHTGRVFGETPKTAVETTALPKTIELFQRSSLGLRFRTDAKHFPGSSSPWPSPPLRGREGEEIRRRSARVAAGFTLIELLLAIAMMAIVLAAIGGMFFTALKLRNTTIDSLAATLPVENALDIMERDIANVNCSTNTNSILMGPFQSTPTNTLPNQVGPNFYTSGGELDGNFPMGCMQKVDYILATPTNGYRGPGKDLIRAVTRNLLSVNQPPQPEEQHAILSGVQSLTFQYYDGTQWDQVWDTTQQTNLPNAVKVQIRMAGNLAQAAPLELVVPMDVVLSTNITTAMQ